MSTPPTPFRPRPLFNLVSVVLPLLGGCTCLSLLGRLDQGTGGAYSGCGVWFFLSALVLGLGSALAALLRREAWLPLSILGVALNGLPILGFAGSYMLTIIVRWLHPHP